MAEIIIEKLYLGANGRLRIRPKPPADYTFIWRDAQSVQWDAGELCVLEISGFDLLAEFERIKAAIKREYGDDLKFSASTEFGANIPEDLVVAMRTSD
jgi:hypothetical protein